LRELDPVSIGLEVFFVLFFVFIFFFFVLYYEYGPKRWVEDLIRFHPTLQWKQPSPSAIDGSSSCSFSSYRNEICFFDILILCLLFNWNATWYCIYVSVLRSCSILSSYRNKLIVCMNLWWMQFKNIMWICSIIFYVSVWYIYIYISS